MPEMDGEEAFHEIKLSFPHAKVILCSGYNEQDATRQFAGSNLDGFIHKPCEMNTLATTLQKILGKTAD